MRLLELFSGTKSVSKAAKSLGWETVSPDICPRYTPGLELDILAFDEKQYPKDHFDFIWASIPPALCESILRQATDHMALN
jgi:hypothetical protein